MVLNYVALIMIKEKDPKSNYLKQGKDHYNINSVGYDFIIYSPGRIKWGEPWHNNIHTDYKI